YRSPPLPPAAPPPPPLQFFPAGTRTNLIFTSPPSSTVNPVSCAGLSPDRAAGMTARIIATRMRTTPMRATAATSDGCESALSGVYGRFAGRFGLHHSGGFGVGV